MSGYGLVPPESGPVLGAWAAGLPPGVLLFLDPGPLVADIPATVLDPVLSRGRADRHPLRARGIPVAGRTR